MMSGYTIDGNSSETLLMRNLPLTDMYTREEMYGNGSIHFKHLRHKIQDFLVVSAADGSLGSVQRNTPPVAQECVLAWCVKTLRSRYSFGDFEEVIIDTFFNTTSGSRPWNVTVFESPSGNNGTDTYYTEDIDILPSGIDDLSFGLSSTVASRVVNGFMDIVPAFTTLRTEQNEPMLRFKVWADGPPYLRRLPINPWLAPNNVTAHMERLATAMTNLVRSAKSREMIKGTAFTQQKYLRVRWEWLAFPTTLLVLTLIFLVATIFKTSRTETGVWKTSAMPSLIYGLPEKERERVVNLSASQSARKRTKKVRVRLLPRDGWRLSGQSFVRRSPILPSARGQRPPGWI
jgi:hypothetical protein